MLDGSTLIIRPRNRYQRACAALRRLRKLNLLNERGDRINFDVLKRMQREVKPRTHRKKMSFAAGFAIITGKLPGLSRSSQPLPDKAGILNGKYLVGSNESYLIFLTTHREFRMISMEELDRVCQRPAESSTARDAELIQASVAFEV